mgnify:CR=1 FL=1
MFNAILIFFVCFQSATTFAEGYGNFQFQNESNIHLRSAAVKDSSETNFIVVGRQWTGVNYMGLVLSLANADGAVNQNFLGSSNSSAGRKLIDFAGAGFDNLCNSVTYVYDGYIVACRSLKSNGYYDIYLAKFNSSGTMDSSFGSSGIVTTGIGGSSGNGHAFVRGITYNANANSGAGHNGVVTIVGGVGAVGSQHPFIASFDQQTGSQYGSTVTESGITGSAVSVEYNSSAGYFYMASTDTSATHHVYLHRYSDSLVASSSPWGTALDLSASGAGTESVPSALTVIGSNIIIVGSNKVNSSTPPWRCMVLSVVKATGVLSTSFGVVSGGSNNKGVTIFYQNSGRDCILNSVTAPPSGSDILSVGTAYNGTNYDQFVSKMNSSGVLDTSFNSTGMKMEAVGPADDVLNFGLYLGGSTASLYTGGRVHDQRLYSGMTVNKTSTTDGSITLESSQWTSLTTTGAPAARTALTLVWTGSKAIAWGGLVSVTAVNTGGLYDPVANSWSVMATASAPSARNFSPGIWTGTKMLVWGGTASNSGLNTGGQYDPVGNSWSQMATLGAPSPRMYPTAVWTGSKMLVWGGVQSGTSYNSGGIYDPGGNSWTSMSTSSAPSARSQHYSAWTGSKMIISGSDGTVNTGGLYDLAGNSWTAITTNGAPSLRAWPSSVWTGTKLIQWGGADSGNNPSNTGAVFDPSNNSWTATSSVGTPSKRWRASSVWTGSRMVIWGGMGSSRVNTGAQYDPVDNLWYAMTTVLAPVGREFGASIWTGSKLLIFGGTAAAAATNTGGLYYSGMLNSSANPAPSVVFLESSSTAVNTSGTLTVVFAVAEGSTAAVSTGDITFTTLTGNPACTKTITSVTGGAIVFTLSGCTGAGTFKTSIAAGVAQDVFGNTSPASNDSSTFTLEDVKPTITFNEPSQTTASGSDEVEINIVFSEDISQSYLLQSSGVTVTTASGNATCSVTAFGSASEAYIYLSGCTGSGTVTVHLNADAVRDFAGNGNAQTPESDTPITIVP